MELLLVRNVRTEGATIGTLSRVIPGGKERLCYILEDKDRGLRSDWSLAAINTKKVQGRTAIPAGRYKVIITFSNRFKRELPLLVNVPGYEGIRIHPGNTAADTEGCLLPGETQSADFVGSSQKAFLKLFALLSSVAKPEEIFITIQ